MPPKQDEFSKTIEGNGIKSAYPNIVLSHDPFFGNNAEDFDKMMNSGNDQHARGQEGSAAMIFGN